MKCRWISLAEWLNEGCTGALAQGAQVMYETRMGRSVVFSGVAVCNTVFYRLAEISVLLGPLEF